MENRLSSFGSIRSVLRYQQNGYPRPPLSRPKWEAGGLHWDAEQEPDWDQVSQCVVESMADLSDTEAGFLEAILENVFSVPADGQPAPSPPPPTQFTRAGGGRNGHTLTTSENRLPPQKAYKIPVKQAQALAKVDGIAPNGMVQMIVFGLANETYGIATAYVREVQPLRNMSPMPRTPDFIPGVINIRGATYPVIDIQSLFGVPVRDITPWTRVILASRANQVIGILANNVLGETSISLNEIKPPLATRAGIKEKYIQGVTRDMLNILNLEVLLSDERIVVHHTLCPERGRDPYAPS